MRIDTDGSAVSLVRIHTEDAYSDIYSLLQSYINKNDLHAWESLKDKIDYLYHNVTILLDNLNQETDFKTQIHSELSTGKKLLFKANGVSVNVIDETTHGAGPGAPICSQWPFVAALMRYFHDTMDISYYQMTFGEASTTSELFSNMYSKKIGRTVTRECTLEGKCGDFYGGFGFYFVRKYLSERHPKDHMDNPMNGYENSVNAEYLPPGKANDRLMLYDLNNILSADRGRSVTVPNGENYNEIVIHKSVIGGEVFERADYPGCVLINTSILKMHAQDLITNAIKNLGIGLYPSYCIDEANQSYKYSHHTNFKSRLPHSPWVMKLDEKTLLPVTDSNGSYVREKTSGFSGTQCDIIKSIQQQGVFILNVSDAINIMNISHNPDGKSIPVPEGLIFASLDPLALDYCCARYCFNNVPMALGKELMETYNWNTEFVQEVPVPYIEENHISTTTCYDSPLFRYHLYDYAQYRGIGQKSYYVTGFDTLTNTPFVSLNGHLGRIESDQFAELITNTLYYNPTTLLHHLQLMVLSYAKCCDTLAGTSKYHDFMRLYDENNDGIIDYDEKGRGFDNAQLAFLSKLYTLEFTELEDIKRSFLMSQYYLKYSHSKWNKENIDFLYESYLVNIVNLAYELSKSEQLQPDLFIGGMNYGQGLWPSWQTTSFIFCTSSLYGSYRFDDITLDSMYGLAFHYADLLFNNGNYTSSEDAIKHYFDDICADKDPLPFTIYVPEGWSALEQIPVPNVVETEDKSKIFTVEFSLIW